MIDSSKDLTKSQQFGTPQQNLINGHSGQS